MMHYLNANYPTEVKAIRKLMKSDPDAAKEKMKLEGLKIFKKGLTIFSSFTSVRNSYQAISLLEAGKIDVSGLISHRLPLSEFERGVNLIEKGDDDVKKVMILPQH